MPIFNFFHDLFNRRNSGHPENDRDSFRNPIWENDEDEDDVDDFRHPRNDIHISIFSDPFQITRFFETEMDNIMKSFFSASDSYGTFPLPSFNEPVPEQSESLRDKMLKPKCDNPDCFNKNESKVDVDLDGTITAEEFSKIWGNQNEKKESDVFVPQQHRFGKSVRKEFIRTSDGVIEQKHTFRDSEGNEETVVSRQVGDKMYTVKTRRDANGVETKTENLVNMDESELKDFTQKWALPSTDDSFNSHKSILNYFPWEKLFGPNPKL